MSEGMWGVTALKSFYGGDVAEKRKALAGHVGAQEREQEVWTPDWIIEAARTALGGTIDLDPCAASKPEGHFARVNITLPMDSLLMQWSVPTVQGAYVNPPYAELRTWMEKCAHEAGKGLRIVMLIPFRPHRQWFWPLLRDAEIVFLNYNVVFKGHKHTFPAALVMVSWNCRVPDLGDRETHRIGRAL